MLERINVCGRNIWIGELIGACVEQWGWIATFFPAEIIVVGQRIHVTLDMGYPVARAVFVPTPIEVFGDQPELNNQLSGKVRRRILAPFLPPESCKGLFVLSHEPQKVPSSLS